MQSFVGGSMPTWIIIFLMIVLQLCEDRPSCSVLASPETFTEDPCQGTSKYLEVQYKCRPDEFERLTVCEGDKMEIWCGKGHRVVVFSAMFGRRPNGTAQCPANKQGYIDCQAAGTISEVRHQCHGEKDCALVANSSVFGDPCASGINKYLTVSYACVPKKFLKPLHHKSGGSKKRRKKNKKKKRKKKKKKKKKKKGGNRLLPEVVEPPTEYTPESTLDTLYETFERGEVTQTSSIGTKPYTSTEELVLAENVNTPPSSSQSSEEISDITTHSDDGGFSSSFTSLPSKTDTTTSPTIHHQNHHHIENETTTQLDKKLQHLDNMNESSNGDIPAQTSTSDFQSFDSTVVPEIDSKPILYSEESTVSYSDTTESENHSEATTSAEKTEIEVNNNLSEEAVDVFTYTNEGNGGNGLKSDNLTSSFGDRNKKDNSKVEVENVNVLDNVGRVRATGSSSEIETGPEVATPENVMDRNRANTLDSTNGDNEVKDKGNEKSVEEKGSVLVSERNLTVLCINYTKPDKDVPWGGMDKPKDIRTIGFLKDWFSNISFLKEHEEKAWLYFTLGLCIGIITLLVFVLVKVTINYRRNIRARLDVSEPTHRSANTNNHSALDTPMLEHSDSIDRIEVVRFSPRGTLRSMRSNSHNRDIVNYYG